MNPSDLTSLANLKAWLGVPCDAGPSDPLLARLITSASAMVVDYLGREILTAVYTEVYDGTGAGWMMLRQAPIVSVQSVSFAGRTVTTPADPVAGTPGYLFDVARLSLVGEVFPYRSRVVVSYTAGYATAPAAVEQATIELAGETFRRRDHIGQTSKTLGGQETTAFSVADMNATIKTMLAPFKAVAPV
jgi:hypothetical protein